MVIQSKRTGFGMVEIREASISGWYALYINGEMKEQSSDLRYIQGLYDQY